MFQTALKFEPSTEIDDDAKRARCQRLLSQAGAKGLTLTTGHEFDERAHAEAERLARASVGGPDASQHNAAGRPGSPARVSDGKF